VLGKGAYGWYLDQKLPMVAAGDFTATTFSLDLLTKDLLLAVKAAGSDLEVTRAALDQAHRTLDSGHSGEDYSAITGHVADEGAPDSF
jgi:3-hydroxyisobutyrate dehydrogenase-like beta-hydroxyacid dehydrogenase